MDKSDPAQLRILWDTIIGATNEAATTLWKMAFSNVVRESRDFSCLLMDSSGRSVAQPPTSIPVFIGTLPRTVSYLTNHFPIQTLVEGDVLATNDPWWGTGQLNDVTIAKPIFYEGVVVGFAGAIAHMSDIGGTLSYGSSGSYFEEGLKIPPVKLLENGQSNEVVMDFIKSNVRSPAQVTGDIEAMLASTQVLESGVVRAMSGAGLTDLDTLGGEFQSRSENAMREALSSFPDGTYRGEARGSVFDEDFIVKVTIEVDGDEARVDFAGTSGESRYAVNCPYNYTYAFSAYALKCVLEPELPNNDGSFRPVHVTAPEGCLLNAVRPAAVEKRNRVGHLIPGAIFQAMSRATPRVMAQSGSAPITLDTFSHRKEGGGVSIHTISNNGGTGARPQGDGIQTAFPSNLSNTPVEITEASLPVRVHRKELLRDSEGAGRWRGGFGQVFEVENLGNAELTHSVLPTRSRYGAEGIDQGGDGSLHRVLLNGQEVELTVGRQTLVQGDVVRIEYPGGGGRGLPSTRDRETIQRDIYSGMLSPERAEKVYGYNKNNG